jgi:aminoglycoside phosphotransferase (APT) family kinase protein
MAVINKIQSAQATAELQGWLRERLPDAVDLRVVDVHVPAASGMSNETVLFCASWRDADGDHREEMVARVAPPDGVPAIFPAYDLQVQFDVLAALGQHTGVPVPRVLFVEEDASILGGAFLVMERAYGRVPADDPPFTSTGWTTELAADELETLSNNTLKVMGDIHAVNWREIGLGFLAERGVEPMDVHAPGIAGQIAVYERYYETFADRFPSRTIEAAFEWLRENLPPATSSPVLLWGDARIGNLMFADDLSVAAVLDWEVTHVGPAECDLGWSNFMMRHQTDALGLPIPQGFPAHDEVRERYEQLTGRPLGDLRYYEVLAGTRIGIYAIRAVQLLIDAGALPPGSTMGVNNAAMHLLAELGGLPGPEGQASTFFGEGVR